jgi:hypothetical protein
LDQHHLTRERDEADAGRPSDAPVRAAVIASVSKDMPTAAAF